jgi:cell division septation protein DedD
MTELRSDSLQFFSNGRSTMNAFLRLPNLLTVLVLTGAAAVLGACSTLTLGEGRETESVPLRSNTASDYAILSCADLAVIETSARQRFHKLQPTTENRAEREILLRSQIDEIVTNREALGCPEPRSATLLPTGADTQPTAKLLAAKAVAEPTKLAAEPVVIQTQPVPASGRFLQVGTFQDTRNAQTAADYFAGKGFRAETRLNTSGGQRSHRVLVGPLQTDEDLSRASNAAHAYGINDAFQTDG